VDAVALGILHIYSFFFCHYLLNWKMLSEFNNLINI
jgi:hypothetical protein